MRMRCGNSAARTSGCTHASTSLPQRPAAAALPTKSATPLLPHATFHRFWGLHRSRHAEPGGRLQAVQQETLTLTKEQQQQEEEQQPQQQEQPAVAVTTTPPEPATTSTSSGSNSGSDGSSSGAAGTNLDAPMTAASAMAAKIQAARNLARRLAEERAAAQAALQSGRRDAPEVLREAEDASVAAAAQAARADSVSRALRSADSSKEQLSRLKAENDMLKELLLQLTKERDQNSTSKTKLDSLLTSALNTGTPLSLSTLLAGTSTADSAEAGIVPPPPPPPRPSPPPQRPPVKAPTQAQLATLASEAVSEGRPYFTYPPQPVPVAGAMYMYYNRKAGPLSQAQAVQLKVGTNKWEAIDIIDMAPAGQLPTSPGLPLQDWWFVQIELPYEIFKFDFVFMDKNNSNIVDNNDRKDFTLQLSGNPSDTELLQMRAAALEAQEQHRRALLEQEQRALKKELEAQSASLAAAAREEARKELAEGHRKAARKLISERRKPELNELPTADAIPGVYCWLGGPPRAGRRAVLAYNRSSSQLSSQGSVVVNVGYDGWWNQVTRTLELAPMQPSDVAAHPELSAPANASPSGAAASWWSVPIDVPLSASVLNFVFCNKERTVWDNNSNTDFHVKVQDGFNDEQLLEALYTSLAKEAEAHDSQVVERKAAQALRRLQTKAQALTRRLAARHQVLYTVPSPPVAGRTADLYYNPELTPLRGRPEVYVRGSWDRWSKDKADSSYTLQMVPERSTGGLGFHHVQLQVPADVWGMDLTFTDQKDGKGGFSDSNGGLDYHIPVKAPRVRGGRSSNGSGTQKQEQATLRVVHIAVEMAPIAKVGGMGDVVTALGRAVKEEGHQVEVILPKYDCINYSKVVDLKQVGTFPHGGTTVRVWQGLVEQLPTTFLEPENGNFWVGCIYGRRDDHIRFKFFCDAAMDYLKRQPQLPNILHCHDWPTAPIAWSDRGSMRCVFTIHNLSYGADLVGRAMASCELATTVSPTYAREISGNGAVAPHLSKLYGIRNGIDPELWDPMCDPFLPVGYGPDNATEGKEAARKLLREKLKLAQVDVPIVSCVTRLVAQKGIHLIKHAAWRAVERGGQFVLLGSAPDARVQGEFNALREQLLRQYHDRAALVFTYDEPLSHLIYAASDLFLVPSMFEPCGLTQMIAMNYGALPVVRRTGGLADTVFDLDYDAERAAGAGLAPNGFVFESTDAAGLDHALNRGMSTWFQDRRGFRETQARVMTQDWSWYSPALDYVELYYKATRS